MSLSSSFLFLFFFLGVLRSLETIVSGYLFDMKTFLGG